MMARHPLEHAIPGLANIHTEAAIGEHQYAVCMFEGLEVIVSNDDQGLLMAPERKPVVEQGTKDSFPGDGIQASRRFVGEQDIRIMSEPSYHCRADILSSG